MKQHTIKAIDLIKKWEGFREYRYMCPAGKRTIGYGHIILKNEVFEKALSEKDATNLLIKDLKDFEAQLNAILNVDTTQNQFDALLSLAYNVGSYAVAKSKGMKHLNRGEYSKAAEEFFSEEKGFVKVNGIKFPGLVKRRAEELKLWNTV